MRAGLGGGVGGGVVHRAGAVHSAETVGIEHGVAGGLADLQAGCGKGEVSGDRVERGFGRGGRIAGGVRGDHAIGIGAAVRERAGVEVCGGVGGDRREQAEGARGIGAALDAEAGFIRGGVGPRECRLRGAVRRDGQCGGVGGDGAGSGARGQRQRGADAEVVVGAAGGGFELQRAREVGVGLAGSYGCVCVGGGRQGVFGQPGKGAGGRGRAVDVVALKGRFGRGIPREGDLRVGAGGAQMARRLHRVQAQGGVAHQAAVHAGVGAGLIADTPEAGVMRDEGGEAHGFAHAEVVHETVGAAAPETGQAERIAGGVAGQRRAQQNVIGVPVAEVTAEEAGEDRAAGTQAEVGGGADRAGALIAAAAVAIGHEIILAAGIGGRKPLAAGGLVDRQPDGGEGPAPAADGEGLAAEVPEPVADQAAPRDGGIGALFVAVVVSLAQVAPQQEKFGCGGGGGSGHAVQVDAPDHQFRGAGQMVLIKFAVAGDVVVGRSRGAGVVHGGVGPDAVHVGIIAVGGPGADVVAMPVRRDVAGVGDRHMAQQVDHFDLRGVDGVGRLDQRLDGGGGAGARRGEGLHRPAVGGEVGRELRDLRRQRRGQGVVDHQQQSAARMSFGNLHAGAEVADSRGGGKAGERALQPVFILDARHGAVVGVGGVVGGKGRLEFPRHSDGVLDAPMERLGGDLRGLA